MVTYRTTDNAKWGVGKGANLTAAEIDDNFWQLHTRIVTLETNPPQANGIASIQVTGTQMTVFLDDGSTQGPFTLPTAMIHYRGDWVADFNYNELDLVAVPDDGLYLILRTHLSVAPFDPNATDANGNLLYRRLVPMAGSTVPEAPADGVTYGRRDGAWVAVEGASSIAWTSITGKPSTFAPSPHVHSFISLTDTPNALGSAGQLLSVGPDGDVIWIDQSNEEVENAYFHVHKNNIDQPDIPPNTSTKITWETAFRNDGGYFDLVTERWTPPAGTILLVGRLQFIAGVVDQATLNTQVWKNGQLFEQAQVRPSGSGSHAGFIVVVDEANGTDFYEIFAYAEGAGNKTVQGIPANTFLKGCLINTGGSGGISDAPIDGQYWLRFNGSWAVMPAVTWTDVTDKPATFPPSTHTHAWGDITGKPVTFAPSAHGHGWGDIGDRPAVIDALPAAVGPAGTVLTATAGGAVEWQAPEDVPDNVITGNGSITKVISLSQAEYDALAVKDPNTLYVTPAA